MYLSGPASGIETTREKVIWHTERGMQKLHRIGMVARWRPVHLGQAAVLCALSTVADQAVVGIGSSNRYDLHNPFTAAEVAVMIRAVLAGRKNVTLIDVPDLDDGPRWRRQILDLFGTLDAFVTANPYVASLLEGDYRIIHPVDLVAEDERRPIDGTMVRRAMAQGDGWRELVPPEVVRIVVDGGLDRRFRSEFGLETLARAMQEV